MIKNLILCALATSSLASLQADLDLSPMPMMQQTQIPSTIIVQNRVLAKVNGKCLSVVDVMKRLDMIFYQDFPHLASSSEARFQFYQYHWRTVLDEMIDSELIVADAKEKKLVVSDGDVREEMEALFGPNVVMTIDGFGLTFQEVWDILMTDITVKRMSYAMVNNKAIHQINPRDIRRAYDDYVLHNPPEDLWRYQVASFQSPNEEKGRELAMCAHALLLSGNADFSTLRSKLNELLPIEEGQLLTISELYERGEKSLSQAHREILTTLSEGDYSQPVEQKSRNSQSSIFRIYALKEHVLGKIASFSEAEEPLKNKLVNEVIEKESKRYREQLRRKFHIDKAYLAEMIPDNFEPFTMI